MWSRRTARRARARAKRSLLFALIASAVAVAVGPYVGIAAQPGPTLTVAPAHGPATQAIRLTYTARGSCGLYPSAEFYWDAPYPHGDDIGRAPATTTNNTCVASAAVQPPAGHDAPGAHAIYAYLNTTSGSVTSPDTSTQAAGTFRVDPASSPTPSASPSPSPGGTCRPSRTSHTACPAPSPSPRHAAAPARPVPCLPDPDFPTLCTTRQGALLGSAGGPAASAGGAQLFAAGAPDRTGLDILLVLGGLFVLGAAMLGGSVLLHRRGLRRPAPPTVV